MNASESPWQQFPLSRRVQCVCELRHVLVRKADEVIAIIRTPWRRSDGETLAAEITPLADACKYLQQSAAKILAPRRHGVWGRPAWLWGVAAETHREALGCVLVIGPGNYPMMLPGIQIAHALVAGNVVLFKPAPGTRAIADWLAKNWHALGVPEAALRVLDENPSSIEPHLPHVDKIVLTGSEATGRAVLRRCAEYLIPAAMELSGCDSATVLAGADLDRTAACLRFGLEFNSSASCIAPRRVLVGDDQADALAQRLTHAVAGVPPASVAAPTLARLNDLAGQAVAAGATILSGSLPCQSPMRPLVLDRVTPAMGLAQEDIMAPITSLIRTNTQADILAANKSCGFHLGASIFGPTDAAHALAAKIDTGCVVINDMMIPTADPRLPFGGHGRSGFGVTRGIEGLLEMTRPKAVSIRRGGLLFHLGPQDQTTTEILRQQLNFRHAEGLGERLSALLKLIKALRRASRAAPAAGSRTP